MILLVFAATTIRNSSFASSASIQEILTGASLFILLAVGETVVIVTRNVDLSVGSTLGLSAFEIGQIFTHHPHTPVILALLIGIGIGAACGAVIGLIQVMQRLDNINEVGRGIAIAFVATIYGVGLANLVFLPAAGKLRIRQQEEQMVKEMMLEGVISIQEGMNPRMIEIKLRTFLFESKGRTRSREVDDAKEEARTREP